MTEKVCGTQEPINNNLSTCMWFLNHICNKEGHSGPCPLGNVVLAPAPFSLNMKFN
jgi:hypothetical protein